MFSFLYKSKQCRRRIIVLNRLPSEKCSSETSELRQPNGSDGVVHQLFRGTLDLDIIRRHVVGVVLR